MGPGHIIIIGKFSNETVLSKDDRLRLETIQDDLFVNQLYEHYHG